MDNLIKYADYKVDQLEFRVENLINKTRKRFEFSYFEALELIDKAAGTENINFEARARILSSKTGILQI